MKRWMRVAARLYPRTWRQRYGVEFDALLDDSGAGWREFFNVLGGAIRMQMLQSRSMWAFVVVCAAVGVMVAVAVSFERRQYVSTASLRIEAPPDLGASVELDEIQQPILSYGNLISIITDPAFNLYRDERRRGVFLEELAARMQRDIRIQRDGSALTISFAYADKIKAQMVTNKLSDQFARRSQQEQIDLAREWVRFRPNVRPPETLQLVDLHAASVPDQPVWPKLSRYIGIGLAAGLALGLGAAFVRRRPKRALALAGFAIVGAVLGAGISILVPDTFISTATILISPPVVPIEPFNQAAVVREFQETKQQVFAAPRLKWIAHSALQGGWARKKRGITEERLLALMKSGDLQVRLNDPPTTFMIQCSSQDRKIAKIVADYVVNSFEEIHAQQARAKAWGSAEAMRIEEAQLGERYEALDLANLPDSPSQPRRLFISLAGLVLGLLAGAASRGRRQKTIVCPTGLS